MLLSCLDIDRECFQVLALKPLDIDSSVEGGLDFHHSDRLLDGVMVVHTQLSMVLDLWILRMLQYGMSQHQLLDRLVEVGRNLVGPSNFVE
jgi:hypothetical protein